MPALAPVTIATPRLLPLLLDMVLIGRSERSLGQARWDSVSLAQ